MEPCDAPVVHEMKPWQIQLSS